MCVTEKMWSVVLRVNSVSSCQDLFMRWWAGWWRPWSTVKSQYLETSKGRHLIYFCFSKTLFLFFFFFCKIKYNCVTLWALISSSSDTQEPSASPAPTRHPQASSILWKGVSSTSTSPLFTCALKRSLVSTLPEAPPQHVLLTLRLRPSKGTSTLLAALRGEHWEVLLTGADLS